MNRMPTRKNIWLGVALTAFAIHCQHARIRVEPNPPAQCKPWAEKQFEETCEKAYNDIREKRDKIPTMEKEYEQVYTNWGFKPREISMNLKEECPKGVVEIYQYSTFKNALFEQLTLGYYSPRTLRLTCLTEEFRVDPPAPTRGGKR